MVAFIGLQLFIWWTGNFGTFNLCTIGLCLLLPIGLDGGELWPALKLGALANT